MISENCARALTVLFVPFPLNSEYHFSEWTVEKLCVHQNRGVRGESFTIVLGTAECRDTRRSDDQRQTLAKYEVVP